MLSDQEQNKNKEYLLGNEIKNLSLKIDEVMKENRRLIEEKDIIEK